MNRENFLHWIEPEKCALVVIDVQNDFCAPEGALGKRGLDVSMMQKMVPCLLWLIGEAKAAFLPVIYLRQARQTESEWPAMDRLNRRTIGDGYNRVTAEGTWGAEFYEGIRPQPEDVIITKQRYCGFTGTDLDIILRGLGAKTLILTGVATNVCVDSTAREGFMRDYDIVLVSDCCAAASRDSHEATLENIQRHFGHLASADEVARAWTGAISAPRGKRKA